MPFNLILMEFVRVLLDGIHDKIKDIRKIKLKTNIQGKPVRIKDYIYIFRLEVNNKKRKNN